ncbi:unnamed protein product [Brassica rapa]|uniref:Uncharacterized protein n=1 Tax=Brassica campestris TaxID=3711 RepID=A0A8D9CQZ9_BRACM|nr:unnamed protein product [Brassica rapa]
MGVRQHTQDVLGCLCVSYTQDVRGCPPAHTGRLWLSCVSISTHISTLVLGLSMLTLPVDCSGDFGPRGLSVQYTQDVCGCPSAHTGRPCVFVSTHRTSGAVRVCLCVSVSTHRTFVAVHQYTYQHVCPWTQHCDFGPCGLSGQYTQDGRGCPPAHTGHPWLSVCVRLCPSANTGRPWLSISTHISTLVLGLSMLALPVQCLGDFGPRGLSVLYTQDVCGSPPAHTARLCLSVAVCQHTQDVRGCPCVSVGVRQHAQDVRSCLWLSVSTHRMFVCVRQHTQDVCGCPCVPFRTHMTSVAVHQYTYQHAGPWTQHAVPSCELFG